jgi:hypothetical protein
MTSSFIYQFLVGEDLQPLLKQPKLVRTGEVKYPNSVLSTRHGGDNFLMEIMLQVSETMISSHHASGECDYDIQSLLKHLKLVRTGEVKYPNSVLSTRHGRDNFLMEIMLQVSKTMISLQPLLKQVNFMRNGEVKYPNIVLSTRHGGDNFLMEIMLQVSETMISSSPC